jgi:hypothetical protein
VVSYYFGLPPTKFCRAIGFNILRDSLIPRLEIQPVMALHVVQADTRVLAIKFL